jgi:esterase/lipase
VDSGLQVQELGQIVFEMNNNTQIKIPVQVFLSEGDWTVDTDVTKQVMNRDYEEVQLVWYKGSEPHHLMVPSVSKVAGEVQRLIFSFEK